MMTIRLPHILCGSYCISSLTWAGCVAYLSRWHAKASVRDKQEYDSHVFFVPVLQGSGRIQFSYHDTRTSKKNAL